METIAFVILFLLGVSPAIFKFWDEKFRNNSNMSDDDMIRRFTMRRVRAKYGTEKNLN